MREDATDWYLRARSELLKSILDELDYENSAANFILASENLYQHGYEVRKGPDDFICDIVAKEELSIAERRRRRKEARAQERSGMEERGRERKERQSYYSTGRLPDIIPSHHWTGRFGEASVHDFVSLFPQANYSEHSLYPNDHPFQDIHHPLLHQNVVSGLPAYIETLRDFYLPAKPGARSLAEQVKQHESLQESHHQKKGNKYITGHTDTDTNEVIHPFAGPLHDSHLHDLYLDNLENWKQENPETVTALTKEHATPEEQDFAIAQAHMDDAIQGWMNKDEDDEGLRTSLGWGGYNLGLEWLSPKNRNKVVEHLMSKGSLLGGDEVQKITLDNGKKMSVGRIKRNIAHRFTPEFFHKMRGQIHTSQNQRKHIEGLDDIRDLSDHSYEVLHTALHETPHEEHGTMAQAIINALNEKHNEEGGEPLTHLNGLSRYATAKTILAGKEPLAGMKEAETGVKPGINEAALHHLLGVKRDKDGEYSFTGKGHFKESESPLSLADLKKLEQGKGEAFADILLHKKVRNVDSHSYSGFNGPRDDAIPEDESDLWMRTQHGPIGNGAIFHLPYIRGGAGRDSLAHLEMLHDWMPKDENGESLIGNITKDGMIMPNRKNMGLFSRYVPVIRGFADSKGDTHSDAQSLWDASTNQKYGEKTRFQSRNTKQTMFTGHSSLDPGVANELGHRSPDERYDLIGKKGYDHRLERHPTSSHNPIMAAGEAGGETRWADNAKLTHNVTTRLGRLHPPHDPADFIMLTHDKMKLPKFEQARSHDPKNPQVFSNFHGLTGKSVEEMPVRSSVEYQEDVEYAQHQVEQLEDMISMYAGDEKNMPEDLMSRLQDAKTNLRHLEEAEGMKEKSGRAFNYHHQQFDEKMATDLQAILSMAKKLKPIMEKADPSAFDSSDKLKFLSNTSRLFYDANRMLMRVPHDAHQLTTYGPGLDEEERESASSLASKVTGETIIPHRNMMSSVIEHGVDITREMSVEDVMSALGFDFDESDPLYKQHYNLAEKLLNSAPQTGGLRAMTHGSLLGTGMQFHPRGQDISLEHDKHINHIDKFDEVYDNEPIVQRYREAERQKAATGRKEGTGKSTKGLNDWVKTSYTGKLGVIPRLFSRGYEEEAAKYGLTHHSMGPVKDPRGSQLKEGVKSLIHDVIAVNPSAIDAKHFAANKVDKNTTQTVLNRQGGREIHPATSLKGANIGDYYTSGGMEHGYRMQPTVGVEWDGQNFIGGTKMPNEQYLHSIQLPLLNAIHGEDTVEQVLAQPGQFPSVPNAIQPNIVQGGRAESDMPVDIGKSLVALMDPDVLIKNDGEKPLPVLPMHRIFSLKDFDALRGFSGEWAASLLPEGERFIIRRKGSRISAYDVNGEVALSSEDKSQLKALSDKNWMLDGVRSGKEIHIVDILEYDDSNIADMNVRERLKVLRGQFDSHEHVIIPGPHNLRLTDDEGLPAIIESLRESGNRILLRDATSTYMRGERRHPKWFLLRPDKKVSLIILDIRGKGPFTYRLGAGPLDAEGLGNRGVEYEGESYLDVGTVTSPKPFSEGDIVNVSVSGVKSKKRGEKTIYDVATSKVIGESDDAPASLETLSLLTKSHPVLPVHFSVDIDDDKLVLTFPEVDTVIYKMDSNFHGTWAHSPRSSLGELQGSDYPVLLAESVKPLWNTAASLMLKGIKPEKMEESRSMSDPKHRKESEDESAGIIDADDEANVLKPKNIEDMAKTIMRIANLVDRVEKEKMTGGAGVRGLGIDVGSQIESPRGPTSLTSEQSLPDWDMIDRPTEDPEEEYPVARSKRLNRKNEEQSSAYEAESEKD